MVPSFAPPSESICPYICPLWREGPHLVTQQHDDHVLLGVLVDLSQPGLEMHKKQQCKTWTGREKGESSENISRRCC